MQEAVSFVTVARKETAKNHTWVSFVSAQRWWIIFAQVSQTIDIAEFNCKALRSARKQREHVMITIVFTTPTYQIEDAFEIIQAGGFLAVHFRNSKLLPAPIRNSWRWNSYFPHLPVWARKAFFNIFSILRFLVWFSLKKGFCSFKNSWNMTKAIQLVLF